MFRGNFEYNIQHSNHLDHQFIERTIALFHITELQNENFSSKGMISELEPGVLPKFSIW